MKRLVELLAASVLAVVFSGILFPSWGIDCVFRGYPFRYAYGDVEWRSFCVLPFLLDVLVFLPIVACVFVLSDFFMRRFEVRPIVREKARSCLFLVTRIVLGLMVCSILFARDTVYREEYESDKNRVTIGDTTFLIGLQGTYEGFHIPLVWDKTRVVSPYHLTIAANVDRTDHMLLVHSAAIDRTGGLPIPAVTKQETTGLAIPLHWKTRCQETTMGPDSFCDYFSSQTDVPLDFARDKNVTLTLDITLLSGTTRQHNRISVPFRADLCTSNARSWYVMWGL